MKTKKLILFCLIGSGLYSSCTTAEHVLEQAGISLDISVKRKGQETIIQHSFKDCTPDSATASAKDQSTQTEETANTSTDLSLEERTSYIELPDGRVGLQVQVPPIGHVTGVSAVEGYENALKGFTFPSPPGVSKEKDFKFPQEPKEKEPIPCLESEIPSHPEGDDLLDWLKKNVPDFVPAPDTRWYKKSE